MFQDIPVGVGVVYEGERIRWADTYVELGGPKSLYKFELARVRSFDEVEDGKVAVVGPDIKDLKEQTNVPFGILVEVAGQQVGEELEGVIERRIHEYCNYIEGFMHLNQRYDIHLRLGKASFKKGLNTFELIGKVLIRLYKSELPIIEKIHVVFITNPDKVREKWQEALRIYETRDEKARGLKDEDVEEFYGCLLCQSFAPTHVCLITPQRYSNCGAISWFDGRASARIDPKGPVYAIKKGETLDPVKGEYTGCNEAAKEKSLGEITRVWLYSAFGSPHTSCGCFEGIAFYIPETDGLGLVHRDFKGLTVNGLPFSAMADSTAGGRQVDGFHGISIEYMRSPKFLQADGGWSRVVWVPASVKERVKDFIPKDLTEKVATETDVRNVEELKQFLKEHDHPVVQRWREAPAAAAPEATVEALITTPTPIGEVTIPTALPPSAGFKIVLKNAKIRAKKVIIRRVEGKG